ncbi:hypothetical protein CROQUDRAFT_88500 [Cronartium quercuum f. sp. fusiforme G11]|uniref:Uncharacterized protein n=1 Tax=Cronartium quercuum f. sp. fusiforme G11 TaxID=708437 RepID=A0A9P6NMN9_9BASI|nr:hypothetical protein CROQUDRAFT_88500 [Cronartium quercuum f. sp. fusiforme G11]
MSWIARIFRNYGRAKLMTNSVRRNGHQIQITISTYTPPKLQPGLGLPRSSQPAGNRADQFLGMHWLLVPNHYYQVMVSESIEDCGQLQLNGHPTLNNPESFICSSVIEGLAGDPICLPVPISFLSLAFRLHTRTFFDFIRWRLRLSHPSASLLDTDLVCLLSLYAHSTLMLRSQLSLSFSEPTLQLNRVLDPGSAAISLVLPTFWRPSKNTSSSWPAFLSFALKVHFRC